MWPDFDHIFVTKREGLIKDYWGFPLESLDLALRWEKSSTNASGKQLIIQYNESLLKNIGLLVPITTSYKWGKFIFERR
jgi:hypothetical protein